MSAKLLLVVCLLTFIMTQVPNQGQVRGEFVFRWQKKGQPTMDDVIKQIGEFLKASGRLRSQEKEEPEQEDSQGLPQTFDARTKWPKCKNLIGRVRDQGICLSAWAVQIASVVSDRLCVASRGKVRTGVSAEDLLGCCGKKCLVNQAYACRRGFPSAGLDFLVKHGAVTEGCKPYPKLYRDSVPCKKKCSAKYNKTYQEDKVRISSWQELKPAKNMTLIQQEILKNGPILVGMQVFQDFLQYPGGVYRHPKGHLIFSHLTKIIGWGVDVEGSKKKKYWLCVNSWGDKWGPMKGYFKIYRGVNCCGIEGMPFSIDIGGNKGRTLTWSGEKSLARMWQTSSMICVSLLLILSLIP